ncbi:MAG: response regulator transcription factor [Firmicutes bacterium]|nr:response regulator transcription factor [Bacillota bacterium]
MANRILVVDDEKLIVKGIKFSLEQDGMTVDAAYDGEEAMRLVRANEYDMVLLDVMLPKYSGLEVCQQIREFSAIPILMVTAKSEDMDKIMGLDYGADDYITKPFNILELKARIKAILRRMAKKNAATQAAEKRNRRTRLRDLEIDPDDRRVFLKGAEINLTAREFDLLDLFMDNRGKVYSREDLLNTVWGKDYPGDARTVDVHVRRLREKIEENPSDPKYLYTKWGVGYYFE